MLVNVKTALLLTAVGLCHASSELSFDFACPSEGRHPDPRDCTGFFTCKRHPEAPEGYSVEQGSCNGHAFHAQRGVCVPPEQVPDCRPGRTSRQILADARYNYLCNTDDFKCLDCKSVINCVNNTAYHAETCISGHTCQTPENFAGSATCYPKEKDQSDCRCDEPNTFKNDPFNDNGFIFCALADSDPSVHQCPGEMVFDTNLLDCANRDGVPSCRDSGLFANPKNCSQYYTCIQTVGEMLQEVFECPEGEMYNENLKSCSDPCRWPKAEFTCVAEGRFADPKNCNNFITCVTSGVDSGAFLKTTRRCPMDYVWNPNAKSGLGHCVSPKSYTSCKPVTESFCKRPDTCDGVPPPAPSTEKYVDPVEETEVEEVPVSQPPTPAETEEEVPASENPTEGEFDYNFAETGSEKRSVERDNSIQSVIELLQNNVQ